MPILPKKFRKSEVIQQANYILENKTLQMNTLEQLTHNVYSAALAICCQLKVQNTTIRPQKSSRDPPWQRRFQHKIDDYRKNIGILQNYLEAKSEPSNKVKKRLLS